MTCATTDSQTSMCNMNTELCTQTNTHTYTLTHIHAHKHMHTHKHTHTQPGHHLPDKKNNNKKHSLSPLGVGRVCSREGESDGGGGTDVVGPHCLWTHLHRDKKVVEEPTHCGNGGPGREGGGEGGGSNGDVRKVVCRYTHYRPQVVASNSETKCNHTHNVYCCCFLNEPVPYGSVACEFSTGVCLHFNSKHTDKQIQRRNKCWRVALVSQHWRPD